MTEEVRVKVPKGKILVRKGKCPAGCSLMNPEKKLSGKPAISAMIRNRGATGMIHFDPYYGNFSYECDIEMKEGDIVGIYCPHCETSMSVEDKCLFCEVPMFAIQLPDGGEVRACPTVGCHNHDLTIVDLDEQIANFFNEERRPKM